MKAIISTTIDGKLGNYRIYKSIKEVDNSKLEVLIYHSSHDSETDLLFALNNLPDTVKIKVYINNTINPIIYNTFMRIHGYVYEDESLLEDSESVDYLCENVGTIGSEVISASDNLDKMVNCISAVMHADEGMLMKLANNNDWRSGLMTVTSEMQNALSLDVRSNEQMREFLNNVSSEMTQLMETHNQTTNEIQKLKQQISTSISKENALHAFGVYTAPVAIPNVLYIRCIGDVNYLTTFLLSFMYTVKATKRKKGKLLMLRPSTQVYKMQYKSFYTLEAETLDLIDSRKHQLETFVSYTPVKQVFDKFFALPADYFIVVDFMQTGKPIIKNGMNIKYCLAYSSIGIFNNVPRDNSVSNNRIFFTGVGIKGTNIIPYIADFCTLDSDSKKRALYEKTLEITRSLCTLLGL